jgi:hypothetical protein
MNLSWPHKAARRSAVRVWIVGAAAVAAVGAAALAGPAAGAMASTSAAHTAKHATTTTMSGVSYFIGVKTMLTAKVKGGSLPKGWVKFIDVVGAPDDPQLVGKTLCSAVLSDGVARCPFIFDWGASYRVEALYEGNMSHKPSHAVATVNETWMTTTTTLMVSPDPTAGTPVIFTATVQSSPAPATDILIFFIGDVGCYPHLADGVASCAYTFDAPGTYQVTAEYQGDWTHMQSSSTVYVTVAAPPSPLEQTATTVETADGTDTATAGDQVTLVGTVHADVLAADSDAEYGPPNQDTITFTITGPDGFTATCANVALTGEGNPVNTADCLVTLPTAGAYTVAALFAGDEYAARSAGAAFLTVNAAEAG